MTIENNFSDINNGGKVVVRYADVELCPICGKAILPVFLSGYTYHTDVDPLVYAYVLLQCRACHVVFMKCFHAQNFSGYTTPPAYIEIMPESSYLTPEIPRTTSFSSYIDSISNRFIEIYNQSEIAKQNKLLEIAGMGYRKALEILIKDYITRNMVEPAKNEYLKKQLAQCFQDLNNTNIETVAKRATWLGNDEAHYLKKFDNMDITDLERLIDLTVLWIEMELKTEEAQSIMPK